MARCVARSLPGGRGAKLAQLVLVTSDAEWDAFVRADAASSFCHLSGWRRIFGDVMGHEDRSRCHYDADGTLRGVLPLVRVRSRLLGDYLVSMPFLNDGGPLGSPAAVRALLNRATQDAVDARVDLLELRGRAASAPEVPTELRRADRKITVMLPLAATQVENWRALHSKVRSQVKRAQKAELNVAFGLDQREAFYELFAKGMRRLGTPVLPKALFARIAESFADEVEFGVIRQGSEPVAVGCGFHWRDQFEITWAASSRAHSALAPNMLLYWEFFERARERGARRFDFGRCTAGSGSHAFKRQWGGADVPLPWLQWSAQVRPSLPQQDRGVFKLASACWSHLPLGVTNRVGPWLAAQLP